MGGSVSAAGAPSDLIVYLRVSPEQPPEPIRHMKRELTSLMSSAGYRLEWRTLNEKQRDEASHLAVAELNGACSMSSGTSVAAPATVKIENLASTPVDSGRVLPFTKVHCGAVTRLLSRELSSEVAARRDYLYGRALARIMAHELYHILAQTTEHDHEGITRSVVGAADLLGERFAFEGVALSRLRRPVVEIPEPSGEDSAVAIFGR